MGRDGGRVAGAQRAGYLIALRAFVVHASVMSRMNFACVVARFESHSTSLDPGTRSIALAIAFSTFS